MSMARDLEKDYQQDSMQKARVQQLSWGVLHSSYHLTTETKIVQDSDSSSSGRQDITAHTWCCVTSVWRSCLTIPVKRHCSGDQRTSFWILAGQKISVFYVSSWMIAWLLARWIMFLPLGSFLCGCSLLAWNNYWYEVWKQSGVGFSHPTDNWAKLLWDSHLSQVTGEPHKCASQHWITSSKLSWGALSPPLIALPALPHVIYIPQPLLF